MSEIALEGYKKVLWVEDNNRVVLSYTIKAEKQKILLKNYSCWDEACEALKKEFDSWDAIILDAYCKHHKDSEDNALQFLTEALGEIKALCREQKHQINWYVLSGASSESDVVLINSLIQEERENWDNKWTKETGRKYYFKTENDVRRLFENINEQANQSEKTLIKTQLFRDVFDAINVCKLGNEVSDIMADLLYNVHNNSSGDIANTNMVKVRKIVECIFRSMINDWGILPQGLITDNDKEKVNLTNCSLMLSGKSVEDNYFKYEYKDKVHVHDKIIEHNILNILNQVGEYIHTADDNKEIWKHLNSVSNSPYLLYGMTMNLCDYILWFKNYILLHPNYEENTGDWTQFEKSKYNQVFDSYTNNNKTFKKRNY